MIARGAGRFVEVVETAHQQCDAMVARTGRERGRFFHRKTESAFARIDVQSAAARQSMRPGKEVPLGHFDGAIDDGSRIHFCEGLPGSRVQPTEHIDYRAWGNSANAL